jgi:tRNA uridine 5-carboxymethylaminomethyl modification enzyme
MDFVAILGLSNEMKAKLGSVRPTTLAQAGRIEGMTPAGLSLLLAHLQRTSKTVAA